MTKKTKLFVWLSVFGFGLAVATLAADFAWAQDFGINAVNNGLGGSLSSGDPRLIVGRIIQIALSFIGAIAIIMIMYAGFLWMTSGGEEEKVSQAKAILRNGVIGLVIILSSWAIATFIITRLSGAVGGYTVPEVPPGGGPLITPGLGAFGACSVEGAYPAPGQSGVPRNTAIMVTFKEEMKLDTVCINGAGAACACDNATCNRINPLSIRLFRTELGDACGATSCPSPSGNVTEVLVSIASGNKILVLTPVDHLGSVNGDTQYSVKLSDQLRKIDGNSMFKNCSSDLAEWDFMVTNTLDLEPPLVSLNGIFPLPDNEEDITQQVIQAVAASGRITVDSCPSTYAAAQVVNVVPAGAIVNLDYKGTLNKFFVSVPAGAPDKAQLFDSNNNLLGLADFDTAGRVNFPHYFDLTATSHPEGSLWTINIVPERLADTLSVNEEVYVFAGDNLYNNIRVPAVCDSAVQAANIQAKLSGHPAIEVEREADRIDVTAKVAGASGNSIQLSTTATAALAIQPLSGGRDREEINEPRDKQDRPMNSAIQLNFNEPINPLTVSGTAAEVANYIRVVNARATSSPAGAVCSAPSDCRSYKCESSSCVGNYLGGKFAVSNNYRTVEFISDRECGVNGCGEKIYCLPANSHLVVELMAADLKTCSSDADCLAYSPFRSCQATPYNYKTCQNPDGKNYPTANLSALNGIVDAAINSLDGNRDTYADGPFDFYHDNYTPPANIGRKDKYKWSFYINDQIRLVPPQITDITPGQGQLGANLSAPLIVGFNTLMLNSSLRSGSTMMMSGTTTQEHKLVNLRSLSPVPLGYWFSSDNLDVPPLDGEPDITVTSIWHSVFPESVTFSAQVGSGVKDIYQNCYKPSVGPGCIASPDTPSCCFGTPTGALGTNGNCQ